MTAKTHAIKDPLLVQKSKILRDSTLFTYPIEGEELVEKQSIFLVLAGLKPLSEANSGHWELTPDGRRTVFDNPKKVGAFLDSLGLRYTLRHDEHATTALISLKKELLDTYERAGTFPEPRVYIEIGKLFGYPETATAAFAQFDEKQLLSNDDQDRVEQEGGLSDRYFVNFRFSKAHWQEELAVCLHWQEVLKLYDLI